MRDLNLYPFGRTVRSGIQHHDQTFINQRITNDVNTYLHSIVPSLVAQRLDKDLAVILQEHLDNAQELLFQTIDTELTRIISDPEYREIREKIIEEVKRDMHDESNWKLFAIAGATTVGLAFAISMWK